MERERHRLLGVTTAIQRLDRSARSSSLKWSTSLSAYAESEERTNERTKKKGRSWRERELLVGRSDVPSDFCFASDKERPFNSLDHGDDHSRHTLSDAPLVSVPKKELKGNYNQTVLRFAKSNVNEAVFVTCFRICFLCVFPFKGSFVSPMTHATNRITRTRNTHIRSLVYTRRSTRSRSFEISAHAEREGRIRT